MPPTWPGSIGVRPENTHPSFFQLSAPLQSCPVRKHPPRNLGAGKLCPTGSEQPHGNMGIRRGQCKYPFLSLLSVLQRDSFILLTFSIFYMQPTQQNSSRKQFWITNGVLFISASKSWMHQKNVYVYLFTIGWEAINKWTHLIQQVLEKLSQATPCPRPQEPHAEPNRHSIVSTYLWFFSDRHDQPQNWAHHSCLPINMLLPLPRLQAYEKLPRINQFEFSLHLYSYIYY